MRISLLIFFLLSNLFATAQTANDYFKDGNQNYDYGDYNAAIESYTKALEISKAPSIYYNRANAKSLIKDYVGAIQDYNQAINMDSLDYASFYGRAECKFMLNDYYGTIYDDSKALKIKPSFEKGYKRRGKAYLLLSKFGLAINDFTKAIKLNPEDGQAYYWRGMVKMCAGNPNFDKDGGCLDFSKAGELGYSDAYEMIRKYCNPTGE